ncbi:MAG: phytanoyl-CoA dioxygenase family protein [Candidatus Hydrogenedentes bacterium]|nr:phytanoyl-CoA dioxygenase family protein [Candidatus Hydrogenedentota bacterium]
MPWVKGLTSHQQEIPEEIMGELRETPGALRDGALMRKRLEEDGYVLVRGALNPDDVLAARAEVFGRLLEVGEVREPAIEGVSTGTSRRKELCDDLGAFWRSVCEGPVLRSVTHAGPMLDLMATLLGGPVRPFDFLWLRPMPPRRASAFHFDHVYMNRGTDHLFTVWTPLGEVPICDGPILLVEGSHKWDDLIAQYRGFDVDKDKSRPGHVTTEPVTLARERGARLITTDFHAGDVLIMTMFMLHGSLDNCSPQNRFRLSSDTRYQLASEPVDERWIGENPIAHGVGYGSMGGSRPANAAPIRR